MWLGPWRMNPSQAVVASYTHLCIAAVRIDSPSDDIDVWWWFHKLVDATIPVSIVKVRPLANELLLVGPFEASAPPQTVSHDFLQHVSRMLTVLVATPIVQATKKDHRIHITVALDCGPVLGAVMGLHRLCFDVFGTAVTRARQIAATIGPSSLHSIPTSRSGFLVASTTFVECMPLAVAPMFTRAETATGHDVWRWSEKSD